MGLPPILNTNKEVFIIDFTVTSFAADSFARRPEALQAFVLQTARSETRIRREVNRRMGVVIPTRDAERTLQSAVDLARYLILPWPERLDLALSECAPLLEGEQKVLCQEASAILAKGGLNFYLAVEKVLQAKRADGYMSIMSVLDLEEGNFWEDFLIQVEES